MQIPYRELTLKELYISQKHNNMNNIFEKLNNPDCEIKQVVVSANEYNFSNEKRLLIPFVDKWGRMGLLNNKGDVVLKSNYYSIRGNCYNENDFLIIGLAKPKAFERKTWPPSIYTYHKFGVIDYAGHWIINIDPGFMEIYPSDDNILFTIRDFDYFYGVIDNKGNEIVSLGTYGYIDIFYRGLARVKSGEKWGIINRKGEIVVPIEYDKIWNFRGKNCTVKAYKDNTLKEFSFEELEPHLKNYGTPPKIIVSI